MQHKAGHIVHEHYTVFHCKTEPKILWKHWLCVLTVSDSLLRPLVMNVKPCVSMATPVFCMCSSAYLKWKQQAAK